MLEEGLFFTFKVNIEYISVDVNLSKVLILKRKLVSAVILKLTPLVNGHSPDAALNKKKLV